MGMGVRMTVRSMVSVTALPDATGRRRCDMWDMLGITGSVVGFTALPDATRRRRCNMRKVVGFTALSHRCVIRNITTYADMALTADRMVMVPFVRLDSSPPPCSPSLYLSSTLTHRLSYLLALIPFEGESLLCLIDPSALEKIVRLLISL